MKLATRRPKWIAIGLAPYETITGISFDCPHCVERACPTCGHTPDLKRLAVQFWPPIRIGWGANPEVDAAIQHSAWHNRISGETFDTLTIEPSIGFDGIGHWHGRITNGECV